MSNCRLSNLLLWLMTAAPTFAGESKLELVVQSELPQGFYDSAFDVAGNRLVTSYHNDVATVWDTKSGAILREFTEYPWIWTVAFSGDGKRLLILSSNDAMSLWDVETGKKLRSFAPHDPNTADQRVLGKRTAISGNGRRILRVYKGGLEAIVYDADAARAPVTLQGVKSAIKSTALSADGKQIITGFANEAAILWDAINGKPVRTFKWCENAVSVGFSSDGKRLFALLKSGTVTVWNTSDDEPLAQIDGENVRSAVMSADGQKLLYQNSKGFCLFDIEKRDGKLLQALAPEDRTVSLALNTARMTALIDTNEDGVSIVDIQLNKVQPLRLTRRGADRLDISDNGQRILALSGAVLWDANAADTARRFSSEPAATHLDSAGITADGKTMLTSVQKGETTLWNASDGAKIRTFAGSLGRISRDVKRVMTARPDGSGLWLWDADSGRQLWELVRPKSPYRPSWQLSNDGKIVLLNWGKGNIELWNTGQGTSSAEFEMTGWDRENTFALSPNGDRILTPTQDFSATLWDTAGHERLIIAPAINEPLKAFVLDSELRFAGIGYENGTIILWNLAGNKLFQTFTGHTSRVIGLVLANDTKRLVSYSLDGTIRIWDTASGKELCQLMSFEDGKDWLVTTPAGYFDGSIEGQHLVSYRVPGTLDFIPLEQVHDRFYRPGLLGRIMKGEEVTRK